MAEETAARVAAYLQRIDYVDSTHPDAASLNALHLAHLYTVPFENLDVRAGRPILLDEVAIVEKIATARRGGFCYELNGAFAWLLRQLGFHVEYLSAQVARDDGSYTSDFDHLVLRVRTEQDPNVAWLADVGFGNSFMRPLRLDVQSADVQVKPKTSDDGYWLQSENEFVVLWRNGKDGEQKHQYRFRLRTRSLADFANQCLVNQTSPDSPFTQKTICTLPVPNGRVSLTDDRLITTIDGRRMEQPVRDEPHRAQILSGYFGMKLPTADGPTA